MSKIVREFTPCFIFRLPPGRHAHVASFATLGWLSFALLINPCFAIWIGAFSSSVWAPLNFVALPWGSYDAEFSRGKVALLVCFVPPLLGLALQFIGPYFYPITWGGEDG